MSWEDEDYAPDLPDLPVVGTGVDKTLEAAEAAANTAAAAVASGTKPKHVEATKAKARDAATAREREEMARAAVDDVPLADPAAERKRLEALMLRADLAVARDSLGGVGGGAAKLMLSTDPETLVAAIAVTDAEGFKALGRHIATRVHELAGPRGAAFAMRFYTEALSVSGDKLSSDDLKALETLVSAARNKKIAKEKEANGKGGAKKKPAAAKMHVGDELEHYDGYGDGDYMSSSAAKKAAAAVQGGNSGNVAGSLAAAGLGGGEGGAGGAAAVGDDAPAFSRSRYAAEESFM